MIGVRRPLRVVEREHALHAGLDLLPQRPLEVGVALVADLAHEAKDGRPGDVRGLRELREAREAGRGIGGEERARDAPLGRRHPVQPVADVLGDRHVRAPRSERQDS